MNHGAEASLWRKRLLAFAILYTVWGSTYLAIRFGLEADLPPALFAGLRLVPAGLILLATARLRGASLVITRRDYATVAAVGVLLLCGGMYFCFMAEELIPSGLAALVVAMVPLWIATAEWFVPGMDRPTARGVVGLLTGFAGLGILLWPRLAAVRVARAELLGMAVMVAGSWLWTAGSVLSKRRPVKVDAFVATGYEMLTAGVLLSVLGLARGEAPRLLRVTTAGWAALAYLVLFGSCIAFTAFVWLMRHAPASKVMTYAYVNPVVAVLLGWGAGRLGLLARPEPIDGWVYAGMAVIVSGVALATTAPTRAAPTVAPAVVPGAAK